MSETNITLLIVISIPFLAVVICWIAMMVNMSKTQGELKLWITPDNLIKGVTIVFVVTSVLEGDAVATILSGVIGYTLGTSFLANKN